MEYVILVDEQDNETGVMEKMQAHRVGALHRAFSVFIFNSKKEMLLQQRAAGKYHSAGLWTNTCCSHPRPGETLLDAATRRLQEEMGLACTLKKTFSFFYKAHLDNDLTEHELDHVFIGVTDVLPVPAIAEVASWKYMSLSDLDIDIRLNPEQYTEWFKICLRDYSKKYFF